MFGSATFASSYGLVRSKIGVSIVWTNFAETNFWNIFTLSFSNKFKVVRVSEILRIFSGVRSGFGSGEDNEDLDYHQKAEDKAFQIGFQDLDFTTSDRGCDFVLLEKLVAIDLTDKEIGQLSFNNGRELLSLMKLGVKKAVIFMQSLRQNNWRRQLS